MPYIAALLIFTFAVRRYMLFASKRRLYVCVDNLRSIMVAFVPKFVFCSAILYYLFWDFWHDGGRFLSGLHGESDVIVCMTDWQPAKLLFRHRQLQGWRIISTRDSMSTHRNLAKSILCNPNKIKAFSGFCSAIMPEDPYFYTLKTPAVYPEWKIFL